MAPLLSTMNNILVFGGTSGIGESFTRHLYSHGKSIIITGRRQDRLSSLANDIPGLQTYPLDNADLSNLPSHLMQIQAKYPLIDTVWVNSASTNPSADFTNPSSQTDEVIISEVALNLTAPMLIARYFVPFLMRRAEHLNSNENGEKTTKGKKKAWFIITGSGLGFVPLAKNMSVYCATKAGVHAFAVCLRDSLSGIKDGDSGVGMIELAVPQVQTDFIKGMAGGMPLEEFTDRIFEILDSKKGGEAEGEEGVKEIGIGFGEVGARAWRTAFAPLLKARGSRG